MSPLSHKEILRLLERLSPDQIREREAHRLDETGLALLEEKERDLEDVEDCLRKAGEQFRDTLPDPPTLELPRSQAKTSKKKCWWLDKTPLWNWLLTSAILALITVAFVFVMRWTFPRRIMSLDEETPGLVLRGGPADDDSSEGIELDRNLFRALMARAKFFYQRGAKEGRPDYLREALRDLLAAHELDFENQNTIRLLVEVYERLGEAEQAALYRKRLLSNPPTN